MMNPASEKKSKNVPTSIRIVAALKLSSISMVMPLILSCQYAAANSPIETMKSTRQTHGLRTATFSLFESAFIRSISLQRRIENTLNTATTKKITQKHTSVMMQASIEKLNW